VCKINILVNNAGNVYSTTDNMPFEKRSLELCREVIDVNLTCVFVCSKYSAAKAIKPAKYGVIINIGSIVGIIDKDRHIYKIINTGGATLDYYAANVVP